MLKKHQEANFYKPTLAFKDTVELATQAHVDPSLIGYYGNHSHDPYEERFLPKSNGGTRLIAVPSEELKKLQKAILKGTKIGFSYSPHAYIRGRSILTSANQHPNAISGFKLDIKDFFHSISEQKILDSWWHGDIRRLPAEEEHLIRFIARVSTRRNPGSTEDSTTNSHLPQGAPTSGLMSNIVGRHVDVSMWKIARRYGMRVTRYSDDILFTSPHKLNRVVLEEALETAQGAIVKHGFSVNTSKTRILTPGARFESLGVMLGGESPRLSRTKRRKVESDIRAITKFGLLSHALERHRNPDALYQSLKGYLAFAYPLEQEWATRNMALLDAAVKDLYKLE